MRLIQPWWLPLMPPHWSLSDRRGPVGTAILWCTLIGIALLIALGPLNTATMIVAGIAAVVVILVRPTLGLALLALAIPFGSVREVALGPATVGAAELLAVLVLATWLAQGIARRQMSIPASPLWTLLALLLAAMFLSVTQSLSLGHSLKELSKWLEFAAVAVCAAAMTRPAEACLILGGSLAAGIAAGLLGWYQFFASVGPEGFLLFGRFMRAYGTFRQPNPYAGYLGIILPMAVSLLIAYWPWRASASRQPVPSRRAERILWILSLATILTAGPAIIMSWSRGAWFGVAAGLLVVGLGRGRRFAVLAVVMALWISGAAVVTGIDRQVPTTISARLTDVADYFTFQDVSAVEPNPSNWAIIERLAHWQAAQRMFEAHPWLGVGIGNYEVVYPVYRLPYWVDPLGHAHNYYWNIAAEAGLVGLTAYLLFWCGAFGSAIQVISRHRGLWRGVALGVLGALAHLSIHNIFDSLYVQGIYLQIALWIGLIISLTRVTTHEAA